MMALYSIRMTNAIRLNSCWFITAILLGAAFTLPALGGSAKDPCEHSQEPVCFVPIDGGLHLVGAQSKRANRLRFDPLAPRHEKPHKANIAPFEIMPTEVKRESYDACVAAGACEPLPQVFQRSADTHQLPVAGVTRSEASSMCSWLGGRLPTGDEWEIAARGELDHRFPWGAKPRCPYRSPTEDRNRQARLIDMSSRCPTFSNYGLTNITKAERRNAGDLILHRTDEEFFSWCEELNRLDPLHVATAVRAALQELQVQARQSVSIPSCSVLHLRPVHDGLDGANGTGFAGNVAEWVSDDAPLQKGQKSPQGTIRGGSFATDAREWRVSASVAVPIDSRYPDIGFRCARSAQP